MERIQLQRAIVPPSHTLCLTLTPSSTMGNNTSRIHRQQPEYPPQESYSRDVIRHVTQNYFHAMPLMPQHDISFYEPNLAQAPFEGILRRDLLDFAARLLMQPVAATSHLELQKETFDGHTLMYFTCAAIEMLMNPQGDRANQALRSSKAQVWHESHPSPAPTGASGAEGRTTVPSFARLPPPLGGIQSLGLPSSATTTTTTGAGPPPPSLSSTPVDGQFNIALQTLLQRIESLYFDLPYHNKIRAAIRVHTTYMLLATLSTVFTREHMIALMIVAAALDIHHPGLTNSFQIYANSPLARLYNYDLPLQNHACSMLFQLMRGDARCDVLAHFSIQQRKEIREMIVYLFVDASRYTSEVFAHDMESSSAHDRSLTALTANTRAVLPLLLHLANHSHMWALEIEGDLWWTTKEMEELMYQADLERQWRIPVSLPPRNQVAASPRIYNSFMQRRYAQVDAALYAISRFTNWESSRLFTHSDWWSRELNASSRVFVSLRSPWEPNRVTPLELHTQLNNEIASRKAPLLEMSVPIETHIDTARKWLHIVRGDSFRDNFIALLKLLPSLTSGTHQIPTRFHPSPVRVVNDFSDETQHSIMQLSHDERMRGIMYHLQMYREMTFDIFSLTALLGDAPLIITSLLVFQGRGLLHEFRIPEAKFLHFAHTMQRSYFANPYHNAIHAADVLQACDVLLTHTLDHTEIPHEFVLALLLAAICHDVDHPGTNNTYQVNSCSYLATLYNNRSVIENHSASRFVELLENSECSIFENLHPELRAQIRALVIGCVLCTDMSMHGNLLDRFKASKPSDLTNADDALFLSAMVLKMADISNSLRPYRIYIQWAKRVCEEFLQQGDLEKVRGYPVAPQNNRDNFHLEKGQLQFLQYIVQPLVNAFVMHFPACAELVDQLDANIAKLNQEAEIQATEK